jgi:hypothetical protein
VRAAVAIAISLLATAGAATAGAACTKPWVGSQRLALPKTARDQGLSLGFDGSVRRVKRVPTTTFPPLGTTPDPSGRWVASWVPGKELVIRSGSDEKTLTTRVDLTPRWRPDGGAIAFGQDEADGIRLQIADAATGFRPRPADALLCPGGSPIWSPDGALIATGVPSNGVHCGRGEYLVIVDATTGHVVAQATVPPIAAIGGWSADGRYVEAGALGAAGATLLPASPATGTARVVPDCAFIGWAPVGARFAASCNGHLATIDASSGARMNFAASTAGLGAPMAWSPDGSRFAVTTQRGFVLARASGASTLIPLASCAGGLVPRFAKNGRVLVQAYNRNAGA